MGLKTTILFSALVAVFFGAGFLINESFAGNGGPTCFGEFATPGHLGTEKRDRILGTNGDDVIITLGGGDRVDGRGGNDKICTGEGKDSARGGSGDDMIDPGPEKDDVNAGKGDDMILARDGAKDEINCGRGNDVAQVDAKEKRIRGCETVDFPYGAVNNNDDNNDDNNDNNNDDDKNDNRDKIRKFNKNFLNKRFR